MLWRLLVLALLATAGFACESDYAISIPRSENGGGEFRDGLLETKAGDGVYVDSSSKVVLNPGLYRGWDFSEGLAVAMRKGEKLWGFIDTTGKFVISPRFESNSSNYVWPFSDGVAKIKSRGKIGYINHSGNFVIEARFLDGDDFHDGMARVVLEGPCMYIPDGACGFANPQSVGGKQASEPKGCKFTYADKTGRVLSDVRFDFARDFSEGLAPVKVDSKWGFIDKQGSFIIKPQFEDAEPFSEGL